MRRVVITGYGCITPAGIGPELLWRSITTGKSHIEPIKRFDATAYASQIAGQIDDFTVTDFIPRRLVKKTDRFTHLALASVKMAIENAKLNLKKTNPERVGVMVGNVLGGWEFAERELRNLWAKGEKNISPYQATAWFSAAPQGNITIQFGIKGKARTFISDRASGAFALTGGAEAIRMNQADVVLAGGTEAPLSPYGWLCCQTSGYLTKSNSEPHSVYRPFDSQHSGSVIGEGSSFVVLEEFNHAVKRGAYILAEITGWSATNDAYYPYYTMRPDGKGLSKSILKSLEKSEITPEKLSYIAAHGSAIPAEDGTEIYGIREALGERAASIPISAPKASIGHLMGAAAPTDLIMTLEGIKNNTLPPTANLEIPAIGFEDLNLVCKEENQDMQDSHCMVLSRGMGGTNVSIILSSSVEA
ncbi:beta-ketoacyl-[acyl-carrier-protein] synthase family protein [Lentibacillus sp. N15]|uniref:beta-ketoacyl-[acyl-carrier-protein] synthase family protein n=1 Tax=Lentibacillus songyuanensis TaxID=3136161 RepID=UPI0031BB685D